ncbi:RICIN domain-containing protein [Streptomyces sp. CA-250714]|uniref:RICIN domain-containing protein n=1 Tax=Streptomyces sp. CA-250714 TaxID=3240060 RepID=UPI003D8CA3B8
MSESGEAQPTGARARPYAPFQVIIADGAATIDGEPVPVLGDQPLDAAILDTLQGFARVRDDVVTAAISNPATGYAVRVEVGPDGSSRVLEQDTGSAATGGATAAEAETPRGGVGGGPDLPSGATGRTGPPGQEAAGQQAGTASIPRPSIPRPSVRRPTITRRPPGGGGTTRGSDEEFEPGGMLKRPWVVVAAGVAVAVLVTTPLMLVGSQGGEGEQKSVADKKKDERRDKPTKLRPSRPPFPSGSASGSPSKKPSKKPSSSPSPGEPKPSATRPGSPDKPARGQPKATIPSGAVNVVSERTDQCLDIPGIGKGRPTTPVRTGACDTIGNGNQRWSLDRRGDGTGPGGVDLYLIRNVKDDLCLDVAGYGPAPATTEAAEFNCRAIADNQLWWFDERPGGTFWIRNHVSGDLCLDASTEDDQLAIVGCEGEEHQWRLRKP